MTGRARHRFGTQSRSRGVNFHLNKGDREEAKIIRDNSRDNIVLVQTEAKGSVKVADGIIERPDRETSKWVARTVDRGK